MTMTEWKKSSLYRPRPITPEEEVLMSKALASIGSVRPPSSAGEKRLQEPATGAAQAG